MIHRTDHVATDPDLLVTQYKGKPSLVAFLRSYLAQVQEIEDVFFEVAAILLALEDQEGEQLDLIGRVLGRPRNGLSDANYLLWLQAQIIVNKSSGLPDEVLAVLALVAPAAARALSFWYPAAWQIEAIPLTAAVQVAQLLTAMVAGGVNLQLLYSAVAEADTFTFADADAEQADLARGWAPDPVTALNGNFIDWTTGVPDDWTKVNSGTGRVLSQVGAGENHTGVGTGSVNFYNTAGFTGPYLQNTAYITGLIVGATYAVEIVISYCSGSLNVQGLLGPMFNETYTTVGTKTVSFVATGTQITLKFGVPGVADVTVDGISITASGGQMADVEQA